MEKFLCEFAHKYSLLCIHYNYIHIYIPNQAIRTASYAFI